jgi:hypothetical protein
MAENECLDLGKSRRWCRVRDAVVAERTPEELEKLAGVCLRQTLNALRKPIVGSAGPQIPLGDFLDAIERGPSEVEHIVKRCHGHDYARLFRDVTLDAVSREDALARFISAIRDKFFDQIALNAVGRNDKLTFSAIRLKLDETSDRLKPEIQGISRQLAENPACRLRGRQAVDTESILGESLLGH